MAHNATLWGIGGYPDVHRRRAGFTVRGHAAGALERPALVLRLMKVGLTFRARDLAMISAAASACIATACATASGGGPAAAPSASLMLATPTGAAAAGGATATLVPIAGSPSPTGLPTIGAIIPTGTVTQADDAQTLLLTVGQQITVVLATPQRMWDQPIAQGSALARVSASGGYPGHTPARAVFRAVAPGTARLTSSTDMRCEHQATPCPAEEENWTVWVVVQPGG